MPKINPHISDSSAQFYADNFRSRNAGAEYALDAFPALYKRTMLHIRKYFSAAELKLIIDVFNATALMPALAGQHIEASVADAIELDQLDKKWEIDGAGLLTRVHELTIFEATCLEIWANGYWYANIDRDLEALDEYIKPLL